MLIIICSHLENICTDHRSYFMPTEALFWSNFVKKNQVTVVCGFLHKKCNGSESVLVTLFPFTHPTVTSKSLSVFCTTVIWILHLLCNFNMTITVENKFTLQSPRHRINLQIEIMWVIRMHTTHTHTHAQFKVEILWKEMCSLVLWPISLYVQLSNNTWEVETHNEGK